MIAIMATSGYIPPWEIHVLDKIILGNADFDCLRTFAPCKCLCFIKSDITLKAYICCGVGSGGDTSLMEFDFRFQSDFTHQLSVNGAQFGCCDRE